MTASRTTALAVLLGAVGLLRAAEPVKQADAEFYSRRVQPILEKHCYSCHSHAAKKSKGGLVVDSREALLKGGDSGPAVVPGDPKKSLLLQSVNGTNDDLAMPPKAPLSTAEVATLEEWIKRGVPFSRAGAAAPHTYGDIATKAATHWAFQPVKQPPLPTVKDQAWVKTPIDAFILAKLEAKGMRPSAPADKRTLIRRATFDLIGLPPTPEEVKAFLEDDSPDAYEKLINRLLDSPHYGERWGRHWLDVARYADTTGDLPNGGRETRLAFAYTYRDYVVRAFNDDKPYNQFIVEQIAADRLPLADRRDLAALGFLTVGKRFNNVADEIIDDRIDAITRGFLGLSVTCARCHDHKFDPITQKDYYGLHGVFASCLEPEEGPVIEPIKQGPEYQDYLTKLAPAEKELAEFLDRHWAEIEKRILHKTADYLLAVHENSRGSGLSPAVFFRQRELSPAVGNRWSRLLQRAAAGHDPVFAPWLAFAALSEKEFAAQAPSVARRIAANADPKRPINRLVANAFASEPPKSMKEVAERYARLFIDIDQKWQAARTDSAAKALPDRDEEALRQVLYGPGAPGRREYLVFRAEAGLRVDRQRLELVRKVNDIKMSHPAAPVRAMVLEDAPTPRNSFVYIRGERTNRGPVVPRQFLGVLAGANRKPFTDGSGRLELARAIADRDNPLTARVMVNRVWAWHFGQGLVTTPSDFGLRGEPPSHPELLDHLARRFMDEGWSLKKLHRWIMLSSTYQQRSDSNPSYEEIDPANTLLWRMNRRRLEFEALRDSLLAVSSSLDRTVGGRPVPLTGRTPSNRRTVYGFIDRLELPGLFATFDFASPEMSAPERFRTTVPQQALFLMNSDFVIEQARCLLRRPEVAGKGSDEERVRALYQLLFQREATAADVNDALEFLKGQTATKSTARGLSPWEKYAQVLLLTNEFVFVN